MIKFRGRLYDPLWLGQVLGTMLTLSVIIDKAKKFDELLARVQLEKQKTSRLRRLGRRIRASLN